ncbi:MAG TPA: serine hydrolase [Gemmatimonadaceae bacterium]|jgi:CubicO group peptidase (beta-lactamase class C family)
MILYLVAALAFGDTLGRLPIQKPESVGMSPERLEVIDRVVQEGIRAGGYPGAAVIIGRQGAAVWRKGFGTMGWEFESAPVTADQTIYDLASLTKVVATTTAAMILFDEGRLPLDAKVADYLPDFQGKWKDEVTIRQLLTHRSGLPAGRELWRVASTPGEARAAVITTRLRFRPGQSFIYSDLGADVLGWVVEAIAGMPLDAFVQQRVFAPLGMHDTFFLPPDSVKTRVAPTITQGLVHDENAQVLGGVAGHAGLFSTADDLAVFAQMMLNGGVYDGTRIVSDSVVRQFTQRAAGSRALGWEIAEGKHGAGSYLSTAAYGHVGYTGTSMWIDPQRNMFIILLTNRVHDARVKRPSTVIADIRADLADAAALAVTDEDMRIETMPASFRADRAMNWNKPLRTRRSRHKRTRSRPAVTTVKPAAGKAAAAKSARAAGKTAASSAKSKATATSSKHSKSKARATSGASKKSGAAAKTGAAKTGAAKSAAARAKKADSKSGR